MRKLVIFFILVAMKAFAVIPNEVALANAKDEAVSIKSSCISMPPVTPAQVNWCNAHLAIYINYLAILQAPFSLTINIGTDGYISPYIWSPYDICKYEPGRLINEGLC